MVENDLSIGGSKAANFFVCGPLGAPTFRLPVLEGVEHFPALCIPQPDVVLLKILGQNLPGHQDFGRGTPSDECQQACLVKVRAIKSSQVTAVGKALVERELDCNPALPEQPTKVLT